VLKLLFVILTFSSLSLAAGRGGGDHVGNGGDICENRFTSIRIDLNSWILKGGASGLDLPKYLSQSEYSRTMLQNFATAKVSCTSDKILVGAAEKTCKNFIDSDLNPRILCNHDRFMKTSESDQYVLVHHEYAGLSGFEITTDEVSHYELSNQIVGYLEDQIVKKLIVKSEFAPNFCSGAPLQNFADLMPPGVPTEGSNSVVVATFDISTRERVCADMRICSEWKVVPNRVGMKLNNNLLARGSMLLVYPQNATNPSLTFQAYTGNKAGFSFRADCSTQDKFNGTCVVQANYKGQLDYAYGKIAEHCSWLVMYQKDQPINALWTERQIVLTGKY
jgi:hypothetical protein